MKDIKTSSPLVVDRLRGCDNIILAQLYSYTRFINHVMSESSKSSKIMFFLQSFYEYHLLETLVEYIRRCAIIKSMSTYHAVVLADHEHNGNGRLINSDRVTFIEHKHMTVGNSFTNVLMVYREMLSDFTYNKRHSISKSTILDRLTDEPDYCLMPLDLSADENMDELLRSFAVNYDVNAIIPLGAFRNESLLDITLTPKTATRTTQFKLDRGRMNWHRYRLQTSRIGVSICYSCYHISKWIKQLVSEHYANEDNHATPEVMVVDGVYQLSGMEVDSRTLHDAAASEVFAVMEGEITKAWIGYPRPPEQFRPIEILMLLISSKRYTMNPSTFNWEASNHTHYISLWRFITKFAYTHPMGELIVPAMLGQSPVDYCTTHGISYNLAVDITSGRRLPSQYLANLRSSAENDVKDRLVNKYDKNDDDDDESTDEEATASTDDEPIKDKPTTIIQPVTSAQKTLNETLSLIRVIYSDMKEQAELMRAIDSRLQLIEARLSDAKFDVFPTVQAPNQTPIKPHSTHYPPTWRRQKQQDWQSLSVSSSFDPTGKRHNDILSASTDEHSFALSSSPVIDTIERLATAVDTISRRVTESGQSQRRNEKPEDDSGSVYKKRSEVYSSIIIGIVSYIQSAIETKDGRHYSKGLRDDQKLLATVIDACTKLAEPVIDLGKPLANTALAPIIRKRDKNDIINIGPPSVLSIKQSKECKEVYRVMCTILTMLKPMSDIFALPFGDIIRALDPDIVDANDGEECNRYIEVPIRLI
ncbi:hypothetical protein DFJ73DRAFT_904608 [Zopfochytrium polystomum]|nr:hypothetical protein DFJ73DRAFT_904608 [Zopfochytrium polystomum]